MAQPSHRDQLVKGAIKCLQTKGYARTTARDIATASGANLASIGYHFGSKEALLNEAMIRLFSRRNWQVGEQTLAPENASSLERLTAMFNAVGDVFNAPRPLFVSFVEALAAAGRSEDLREQLATHYRDARQGIAAAVAAIFDPAGGHVGDDAEVMASLLMALFDGLVLQWLLDPDATPSGQELIDALVKTMTVALNEKPRRTHTASRDGGRRRTARKTGAARG